MPGHSRYVLKQSLIYYLLGVPALVSELLFSLAVVSNPEQILSQVDNNGFAAGAVQVLPWLVLLISVYAVLSHRTSALIALLVVSFFVSATVTSQMSFLGYDLSLNGAVALLIFSSFTSLIGFNYSRSTAISGKREVNIRSSGPLGYQLLSVGLELTMPLVAALGLVSVVLAIFSSLKAQASQLPEPLASLSTIYLQTRFGTVFTTIAVAGATIWVMREFLEPLMLYFTLSRDDGIRMAEGEVEDVAKKVRKEMSTRPSAGVKWSALVAFLTGGILLYSLVVFGPQQVYGSLLSVLGFQQVVTSASDYQVASAARDAVIRSDVLYAQAESVIQGLIRLIWG